MTGDVETADAGSAGMLRVSLDQTWYYQTAPAAKTARASLVVVTCSGRSGYMKGLW